MLEKFLTKDNIIIVVVTSLILGTFLIESQYFATRYDVLLLKNELLQQKIELQSYSDKKDAEVLAKLDEKYEKIIHLITQLDKKY